MDFSRLLDILQEFAENKVKEAIQSHKWKHLFVETGELLISSPDAEEAIANDLQMIFSNDNMIELAKKMENGSGIDFCDKLHGELYKIFQKYDMTDMADTYIQFFIQGIMAYLQEKDPQLHLAAVLSEWEKKKEQQLGNIEKTGKEILREIQKDKLKTHQYSIENINTYIQKNSKYHMDLSFFEIDDDRFMIQFDKLIKQRSKMIFVEGLSREETLYRVLNHLKGSLSNEKTWIVTNEETWEELIESKCKDMVLIPYFYAPNITAIPENINIFIHGEDESCSRRDKIVLKKRTRRNITKALENIGIDGDHATRLFEYTHGLYASLKRELFDVDNIHNPEWAKNHDRQIILTALLCGKWTDADGDKEIIEKLSGESYDNFMSTIHKYEYGEDPFVIAIGEDKKIYQIASVVEAWVLLKKYINIDLWKKFRDELIKAMKEPDPVKDFVAEYEAAIKGIKRYRWSKAIKTGMIRSCILWTCIGADERDQNEIYNIVKQILDTIGSYDKWVYISEYITELCEASPDAVLERIENELNISTGMLSLFENNTGYTSVLWAMEQMMQTRKYIIRVIKVLWELDSKDYTYQISNSPQSELRLIFCAWYNAVPLTREEKIGEAKKAIKKYENGWKIIADCLCKTNDSIFTTLNKPWYKEVEQPYDISIDVDVPVIYNAYLDLCVETAENNPERWIILLKTITNYEKTLQEKALDKLILMTSEMNDSEKTIIKEKIRQIIYSNRYFYDANWAVNEECIAVYEKVMDQIEVDNPVYNYIYLFHSTLGFPLLHPIPNDKEDISGIREENEELAEQEIEKKIKEFKENGYSVAELISIGMDTKEQNRLGYTIAHYYDLDQYNEKNFSFILEQNPDSMQAYDYARCTSSDINTLVSIINDAKRNNASNKIIAAIISLQVSETIEDTIIFHEVEDIKKAYWSGHNRFTMSDKASFEVLKTAIEECFKWGCLDAYINLLYSNKDNLSIDDLLGFFLKTKEINNRNINNVGMTKWYFEEVVKIVQKHYLSNDEICFQIAQIEWWAGNLLDWSQMLCSKKLIQKDPRVYAGLVEIVCKKDAGIPEDPQKKEIATKIYGRFRDIHFCPGEKNGTIEYNDIKKWVEEFITILEKQHQSSIWDLILGELLPYSPVDEDGYMPCKAVRRIIEEYYTENMERSYATTVYNMRGVYSPNGGKGEEALADKYEKNAEMIERESPYTAKIYRRISNNYRMEAVRERKLAEDVW